ncbi:hypothetical protein BU047_13115, partial [Staphylococcus simulans]|uniref:hypothetical protein n=1 Tax=Staphylococcus simulans TaxID=1286 RepID=UPI000D1E29AA
MIKKISTNTHTFLVEEVKSKNHNDAIFGKSVLLSIYVGFNTRDKSKNGSYYYNGNVQRIANKEKVISIEEPTKKDMEFFELLNEKEEINFSISLAEKYEILKYIRTYFSKEKNKKDQKKEITYPSCPVYYS